MPTSITVNSVGLHQSSSTLNFQPQPKPCHYAVLSSTRSLSGTAVAFLKIGNIQWRKTEKGEEKSLNELQQAEEAAWQLQRANISTWKKY
jgi:hypothetical protein